LSEAADAAHVLDMKYVGISSIPAAERRTLDGYKRVADEFNQIGARASKSGVRFTYHNHGYGLTELEGQIPLRMMLDQIDPTLVAMEMDLFCSEHLEHPVHPECSRQRLRFSSA